MAEGINGESAGSPLEDMAAHEPAKPVRRFLDQDYHERLTDMLKDAASVQMGDFAENELEHMRPDYVGAFLIVKYAMHVKTDKSGVSSTMCAPIGVKDKGKEREVIVPTSVGIGAFAEVYGNKVVKKTAEITPTSSGVVKDGQIQDALPRLVRTAIEEAIDKGSAEEKRLRNAPKTEVRQDYYANGGQEAKEYMSVEINPMDITKDLPKLFAAASRIKKRVGDIVSTKLDEVKVEFNVDHTFRAFYGLSHKGEVTKTSTKEARISLNVETKMDNGVTASFFTGATGGLEGLRFNEYDPKEGTVRIENDFEKAMDSIAEKIAHKLLERDTDENISAIGSSAPVILSQQAAAFLFAAVVGYASGTLIKEEMARDKKGLKSNIGRSILPRHVSIKVGGTQYQESEGARHYCRFGAMEIDAEGTPVRPFTLVDQGTLVDFLKTRDTLLPVGDESESIVTRVADEKNKTKEWRVHKGLNGSARQQDYTSDVIAAPGIIDVQEDENGGRKLEDLTKAIGTQRSGLYLESVEKVTYDTEGNIELYVDLGYFIQNGEVNREKRVSRGRVKVKLENLRNNIIAISGKGTALATPLNANYGKQTLPTSVNAPIVVIDKADLSAGTGGGYGGYKQSLEASGFDAFYRHVAEERNPELCPKDRDTRIFTGVAAPAKALHQVDEGLTLKEDGLSTVAHPDYKLTPGGELSEN